MIFNNTYIISSYSDFDLAKEIMNTLKEEGLYCEIGQTSLIGEELDTSQRDLKNYDLFIIIWSKDCAADAISNYKIAKAITLHKKLLIINIDETTYPDFLHGYRIISKNDVEYILKLKNFLGINLSSELRHTKEQREDCIGKYEKEIQNTYGFLKVLGSGNQLPLNKIYLPLYIKSLNSTQSIDAINLIEISSNRIIILGNPGTGKTTLLKYLSLRSIQLKDDFMPFILKISELMKTEYEILDYITILLKQQISKPYADVITKDESFCKSSKYLILLDGLDEISIVEQQEFYNRLKVFFQNYPKCKIIITSRFNGYERQNFNGFEEFQIEQLRHIDIEKYIWTVCEDDNKRNHIWSIIKADSRLLELSKTPFLLAMICALPDTIGSRANQRAILFQQCTQYLLRNVDWESDRQIVGDEKAKILESALQNIAIRFFKLDRNDKFDLQELEFILGRMSGNVLNIPPSEIIKLICENSGLLQKAGSVYHFIHRSIWEYFVAKAMLEENVESIFERTNISAWEEPIRIYVGLKPERDLQAVLNGIWKQNKGLALRCMMEVENFPEEILTILFKGIEKEERISVVRKLRDDISTISSKLDAKRILMDTLTALLRIEKDCEVIFHAMELLNDYKGNTNDCEDCEKLIINTLDLSNAEKRRNKLLNDPKYFFEFICIPEGKFIMGKNNLSSTPEEKPEHPVKLDSFCIGKYPVTNNVYYEGSDFPFKIDRRESRSYMDNQPVISITWYEAYVFAKWLGCDLPTEAEWEYACRVGGQEDEVLYNKKTIHEYAWFVENSNNQTHNVGGKLSNKYKLFDMIGNVREWCKDWFDPNYYAKCLEKGEVDNPQGPIKGIAKVMRGGCFDWNYANLVPTYRNYNQPSDAKFMNGVRLVFRDKTVTQTSNL